MDLGGSNFASRYGLKSTD